MKKWIVGIAVIAALCGLFAWYSFRTPEAVATNGKETRSAQSPGKQSVESASASAGSKKEESQETNQRTRPSQPPPERSYIKPPPEYPVAEGLKDKPGFVISPHNGKIVDVQNIPKGTLVADPTYPPEEKKYFRVP